MRLRNIFIIILMFLSVSVMAQGNLDQYLETAAKNNPGLKSKFNEYLASLEVIPQVGVLPDPQLAFGYFIQPVETKVGPQRAKISLTQMFPWFGTLDAKEDVAIQKSKAKFEAFEEAKSNLFFEIKSAYYDMYFVNKAITTTLDNIQILGSFRNLALIKIESGKGSGVNEIRVEMEIVDLENDLVYLKDKLHFLKVKFNKLQNVSIDEPVEVISDLANEDLKYNVSSILDSLRFGNHSVKSLDFSIKALESKKILADKSGKPNISIGLDYIAIGKSDNTSLDPNINGKDAIVFPKIGITIPLYRKKYNAIVNEVVLMQQSTEDKKSNKINMLETLFEKAYFEYKDADRRIDLYQKQLELVDKAIAILESEYSTDGRGFEEILRMQKRKLKFQLEAKRALSDKHASIAFIEFLMGK